MPRKRGAPPGNRNAYRHGFYSRQFKAAERRALDASTLHDLAGEIEFVRVELRRFIEVQDALPEQFRLEAQLAMLRAVTLAKHQARGYRFERARRDGLPPLAEGAGNRVRESVAIRA